MNAQELAALISLAETGVTQAIQLYKFLEAKAQGGAKPLADVLASADAAYDAVIAAAQAELGTQAPAQPTTQTPGQ